MNDLLRGKNRPTSSTRSSASRTPKENSCSAGRSPSYVQIRDVSDRDTTRNAHEQGFVLSQAAGPLSFTHINWPGGKGHGCQSLAFFTCSCMQRETVMKDRTPHGEERAVQVDVAAFMTLLRLHNICTVESILAVYIQDCHPEKGLLFTVGFQQAACLLDRRRIIPSLPNPGIIRSSTIVLPQPWLSGGIQISRFAA